MILFAMRSKRDIKRFYETIKRNLIGHVDICFVMFIGIAMFCVSSFLCIPRQFTDDDWGIANYFAGVIEADYATPYNKFISFIWGWIMYILYKLIPGPNWFIVIQEFIVVLSFAILQYMLIQKMKEHLPTGWCYLLTSVFLVTFEPSYICRLEFTQTATLGSIIGMILMFFSYEKGAKIGYIGGIILTVVSALHRFGSFEMCLPFVGLVLIHYALRKYDRTSIKAFAGGLIKDVRLYVTFAGIIIGCFVVSKINTAIYNSDYYADYNAFNSARASVMDYPKADYADIAEELQEIGVSANDYSLMTSWTFVDLSFFTTDLFRQVAAIEPKASTEIDYKTEIDSYFTKLQDPELIYNKMFYLCLIVLGVCIVLDFKHMILYSPMLLAGTILIEIYFTVVVKRYPTYVRTGLLFALLATALMIVDFKKLSFFKGKGYLPVATSFLIFFGLYPLGDDYFLQTKGTFEYNMDGLAMYEYMNSREDDIFMIPTGDNGGLPALRNSYSIFTETKPGIMRHTVGWGGWSTNNPWVNEAYSSWGIDYPMSQAADANVYLLASVGKVDSIRTYLSEHRGMDTSASLSSIEYGTTIYKLSDNNWNIKENLGTSEIKIKDCTYDETYGTYDISFEYASAGDSESEIGRVYLMLTDPDGLNRYFMVFNGHDMSLSDNSDLLVKVPVSYIENDKKYAVNVMMQRDDGNYLLCENDAYFSLEENLH